MHPFKKDTIGLPQGVSPHLDVRLKPGWRFDRRRRALVSEAGHSLSLRGVLSPGARIVPMTPSLATRRSGEPVRRRNACLPGIFRWYCRPRADSADLAGDLRGLEGVESV